MDGNSLDYFQRRERIEERRHATRRATLHVTPMRKWQTDMPLWSAPGKRVREEHCLTHGQATAQQTQTQAKSNNRCTGKFRPTLS